MNTLKRWTPSFVLMGIIFALSSTPSKEMPHFGLVDFLVKKGGHMFGYGLLALANLRGLNGKRPWLAWMLTLAFAQITWSIAFQWDEFTGGSNGINGVWPADWLSDKRAYYFLTLALLAGCTLALRRMLFSPFGYAMRAGRDSPLRADAIGISTRNVVRRGCDSHSTMPP